jgi:hypothetical protein
MTKTELDTIIKKSEYVMSLKDNWDDEGAVVINHTAYKLAVRDIYALFNSDINILDFYITPASDGSVDTQVTLGTKTSSKKMFIVSSFYEKSVQRYVEYIDI